MDSLIHKPPALHGRARRVCGAPGAVLHIQRKHLKFMSFVCAFEKPAAARGESRSTPWCSCSKASTVLSTGNENFIRISRLDNGLLAEAGTTRESALATAMGAGVGPPDLAATAATLVRHCWERISYPARPRMRPASAADPVATVAGMPAPGPADGLARHPPEAQQTRGDAR